MTVDFQSKLAHLPGSPGVYLFKNEQGEIIYIGKAAVLADRVRSYFQKGADHSPKTGLLVSCVTDVETLVTRSELEALILESNLVKRHKPRFNIVLRDDKQYPYVRLPIKDDFPRLSIVRRVQKDGALYYGPYTPANALRETLKVIKHVFPLATCAIDIDGTADRACIEFEIKRCMAPCTGNQSKEEYHQIVKQVRQFLEGRDLELLDDLRARMETAADREEFEEAARLRDRLFKIQRMLEKQRITQTSSTDQDVIGLARQGSAVDLQILFVRGGLLIGRKDFFWPQSADTPDEELVRSAIEQFYNKDGQPPREVLSPAKLEDAMLIEQWLSDKRGEPVRILTPERGAKHQLVLLAEENAAAAVADHLRDEELDRQAGEELKRLLRLEQAPHRIEGFDISNTMGNQSVASMVVWEDGQMKKADYRRFKIQTVTGANDFASMKEVVTRRYRREENLAQPDLILIDGGLGQLAAALEGLKEAGHPGLPILGLAKARGDKEERVFLAGRKNPIVLRSTSPATHLLQHVRDEAHRFAITFHRKLRGKSLLSSKLDQVVGIGEIRRNQLLNRFGSLDKLVSASDEALREAGLTAETVLNFRRALEQEHPSTSTRRLK
ncbi:excinuclease ABC subunit UvrC [Candidatus Nitrospira nitrificans]|uniref:UvrABC system protein C n=1 Tax=Candidatus Nitrospira nitrificans TaxID=1742973 RepID=A0A0S4LIL2_9BACT|nr:excinuclease ABC subunit UvrC [Candidatus Nitrospira nitrificans]CUS35782.1 UvrABC system protein C [Candidatus Nitrospira nitrificans]